MAWCPVCKNEYRPGIKVCADCGAELVESLEQNPLETLVYGEEAMLDRIIEFLKANGIKGVKQEFDPEKGMPRILLPSKEIDKAMEYTQVFMREHLNELQMQARQQALENATPEEARKIEEEVRKQAKTQNITPQRRPAVYESSQKKAEENKASAWSLLLVGGVGLILIVLCFTGVIKLPFLSTGSYLFFGVSTFLCIVFLIAGFVSFKNAKGLEKNVESENSLRNNLVEWCRENLNGEEIDRYIKMHDPSLDAESLFFPRNELIKARINHQFMNLDQAFLEQFVDECVYEMVFPEDKA